MLVEVMVDMPLRVESWFSIRRVMASSTFSAPAPGQVVMIFAWGRPTGGIISRLRFTKARVPKTRRTTMRIEMITGCRTEKSERIITVLRQFRRAGRQ